MFDKTTNRNYDLGVMPIEPVTQSVYVVETPSGVNQFALCILGSGPSRGVALEDAFGPKPWSPYVKGQVKKATVRKLFAD